MRLRSLEDPSRTGKAPNTEGTYEAEVLGFIDIGFSGLYQPPCAYGLFVYMSVESCLDSYTTDTLYTKVHPQDDYT